MDILTDVSSRGTKAHPIRCDEELWQKFLKVCDAEGTNGSEDIRGHIGQRVEDYERANGPILLPPDEPDE